jgi:lysophospholipase L1-like esterase
LFCSLFNILMNILKKILPVVLFMLLLAVIKYALNRLSPSSYIFHSNLITSIQWFLLLGIICWLLLQLSWKLLFRKDFSFFASWIILIVLLALAEWRTYRAMQHAAGLSPVTQAYLLKYYLAHERTLPEARPDCAQYDPELLYIYKAGAACVRKVPEFSDSIYINSAGLRDDEASLQAPRIICLGDSYTMGSGVEQQETYAQVLERASGWKVLNAGVSSYGTARETMLLKRLDTSALQYVVLQFCFNDLAENETFTKNNHRLPIRSQSAYNGLVQDHYWATLYYPFKRVLTISRMYLKDQVNALSGRPTSTPVQPPAGSYDTSYVPGAARQLADILYRSGLPFGKVKLLVADMNRYPVFDHHLQQHAAQLIQAGNYSQDFKKNIHFIDMSPINHQRYYYPLDNHLNAEGHALLGELIFGEIKKITLHP